MIVWCLVYHTPPEGATARPNRTVSAARREVTPDPDKDDTGRGADTVTLPDGTVKETRINQEILTMRGWVPGTYVLNLHLYALRDREPVPVTVTMMRVSRFERVFERQIVLDMQGQEETVAQFEIGENGEVRNISHEFVQLARKGPLS